MYIRLNAGLFPSGGSPKYSPVGHMTPDVLFLIRPVSEDAVERLFNKGRDLHSMKADTMRMLMLMDDDI